MKITLSAPAKINLTLGITGLREDGYHLLESIMQALSLADTVTVEDIPCGIILSCNKSHIPTDERNLCHKAARKYFEAAGVQGGVKIHLIKCIPDGAGMGGGSSDAAAVLKAMRALYPAEVDLLKIASSIGADVPFFLQGGTMLCSGVGEILEPITLPQKAALRCVVTKPEKGLSTPEIYKLYDRSGVPFSKPLSAEIRVKLEQGDTDALFSVLNNDLELPAISVLPEIAARKEMLLSMGADCAMMTGSGSAVFGLFREEANARACHGKLNERSLESYFCTLL
ncbi:MAG: 4-(cytidine 5'-diphospho)-2-C-methyl-D-erythritol kinase [Ruminococcaceae bacterium]|nr:4-(cytidine 5'-diphospho)-2-C-methyl-D-erythritol kinase [Oscillospiraceae bacterium]